MKKGRLKEAATVWFQSEDTTQPMEDTVADDFRMVLDELLRKAQLEGDVDDGIPSFGEDQSPPEYPSTR